MAVWFWLERRRPSVRWPVIVVGLLLGLAVGLVMALAFWAIRVRPQARRSIAFSTIALGAAVTLAAWHSIAETFDWLSGPGKSAERSAFG